MAEFTSSQRNAFDLVLEGHNICLTGLGGTGKSFLLKEIFRYFKQTEKKVMITCSTGKACALYEQEGATTLHSWAGLKDGRFTITELLERIDDETFEPVRNHIKTTDILIIDEISMISSRTFDQVEHVCRHVRQTDRIFGGIQLVVAGDFYQLPPVPNELYGDTGKQCFLHPNWKSALPHHIELDEVMRQDEVDLIQAINSLEKGTPSKEDSELIESLSRPLDSGPTPTYIYATNFEADMKNHDMLEQMPGERKLFKAKDKGNPNYFKHVQAPEKLALKVGCPVMLICNLGGKLLNGVTGLVTNIEEDGITCCFGDTTHKIRKETFTVYDPVSRTNIAERIQFPLKLCFAITIHKSQGMTLDRAIVICKGAFLPGQIGVAVGRVKCKAGLQVLNYDRNLVRKHPEYVDKFYAEQTVPVSATCCQGIAFDHNINEDLQYDFKINSDSSDDCGNLSDTEFLHQDKIDEIIDTTESADQASPTTRAMSQDLLKKLLDDYHGGPNEIHAVKFYDSVTLLPLHFYAWIQQQKELVEKCINTRLQNGKPASLKQLTGLGTDINVYLQSDGYLNSSKALLASYIQDASDEHFEVLTSIMFLLEHTLLNNFCAASLSHDESAAELVTRDTHHNTNESIPDNPDSLPTTSRTGSNISVGGYGKIRHIGGFCIAKLKWKKKKMVNAYMFNDAKKKEFKRLRTEIDILSITEAPYSEIEEKETLQETFRKQNLRESLTYISDETLSFFEQLEVTCRDKISDKKLTKYGEYLFKDVQEEIKKNENLRNQWQQLFKGKFCDEIILSLYIDIVKKFVKVYASQFRRTYLLSVKREKGIAHRKKVMAKKDHSSKPETVSVEQITANTCETKSEVTQLRLKAMCLNDKQCFNTRAYTKKQLMSICKKYDVKARMKDTKKVISEKLSDAILKGTQISSESSADNQTPSTSDTVQTYDSKGENDQGSSKSRKRKCPSKSKAKKKKTAMSCGSDCEQNTSCSVCGNKLGESDLIACDLCDSWLHRHCANILGDEDWKRYQNGITDFFCPQCNE